MNLEFRLCAIFDNSLLPDTKGFWCDGVLSYYDAGSPSIKRKIFNTRTFETTAWLGKSGQDRYQMTIKLGKYSFRRYSKGDNLLDCIPDENESDQVSVNVDEKKIVVLFK